MWLTVLIACATTAPEGSPPSAVPDTIAASDNLPASSVAGPSEVDRCTTQCIADNQMRAVAAEQIATDCAQSCDPEGSEPGLTLPNEAPDQP